MKNPSSLSTSNFGDIVEAVFHGKIINGTFIKYDGKLVLIKLKSGYDVALLVKELSSFKIIKKETAKTDKTLDSRYAKEDHPNIALINTGGTISSKIDYKTGGVSPSVPPEYYFKIAPGLKDFGKIEINPLMSVLSENMKPLDWIKIAKAAYSSIKKGAKGVIVTMGTDTMHYAAAALSFLLNPLSVPIVFTGAQRSTDRGSTDASTNLLLSAITASKWEGGESVICMHATTNDDYNLILRGNCARKMHSERRDAFRPINFKPLGKVFLDGRIERVSVPMKRAEETVPNLYIDQKVRLLMSYPGMDGRQIEDAVKEGIHGIVLAGTGFGNIPLGDASIRKALSNADAENVPIAITSQTIYGPTNKFVYSTMRELSMRKNILYLGNMTTETALVKLMFVLGKTKKMEEIRKLMVTPLAGESSERNEIDEFLI
ncbi:MAG: Glu-tRNA(Gln) amidotransferase subunit GatD [Candidatus Parvarchaeota archaeon]|nr:Glu-tRNA(Gln) amidotransferase subunit GatD [Candidatus Parvarchaeota archaeon]